MNLAENLSVTIREQVSYVSKLTQTPDQTPRDNEGPEDQNLRCACVQDRRDPIFESIVRNAKGGRESERARQQYTAVQMSFQNVILTIKLPCVDCCIVCVFCIECIVYIVAPMKTGTVQLILNPQWLVNL